MKFEGAFLNLLIIASSLLLLFVYFIKLLIEQRKTSLTKNERRWRESLQKQFPEPIADLELELKRRKMKESQERLIRLAHRRCDCLEGAVTFGLPDINDPEVAKVHQDSLNDAQEYFMAATQL